jgi:hypothetical protein
MVDLDLGMGGLGQYSALCLVRIVRALKNPCNLLSYASGRDSYLVATILSVRVLGSMFSRWIH